jgi:hypothetical protein
MAMADRFWCQFLWQNLGGVAKSGATGGQSDQWQTDFGADFWGKFGKHKAWQNLNQEPASEGNM